MTESLVFFMLRKRDDENRSSSGSMRFRKTGSLQLAVDVDGSERSSKGDDSGRLSDRRRAPDERMANRQFEQLTPPQSPYRQRI